MVKKAKRLDSRVTSLAGQPVAIDRKEYTVDDMVELMKERKARATRERLLTPVSPDRLNKQERGVRDE